MDHEHGIRGGEFGVPQHCNATQNQSKTPLVERLMRAIVAPDSIKSVPAKKNRRYVVTDDDIILLQLTIIFSLHARTLVQKKKTPQSCFRFLHETKKRQGLPLYSHLCVRVCVVNPSSLLRGRQREARVQKAFLSRERARVCGGEGGNAEALTFPPFYIQFQRN